MNETRVCGKERASLPEAMKHWLVRPERHLESRPEFGAKAASKLASKAGSKARIGQNVE
jgi:hypothetical protein